MSISLDNISIFESLLPTQIMVIEFKKLSFSQPSTLVSRHLGRRLRISGGALLAFFAAFTSWHDGVAKVVEAVKPRLYINYSAKPDPQDLTTFDFCILDPEADADLKPGQSLGHSFLAYVSTVEVRPGSPMEKLAQRHRVPVIGKNADWGTQLLDITDEQWLPMMVNDLARSAITKGFDGFFLDTLDSAELLTRQSPAKAQANRQALVKLVRELRAKFPAAKIIINRGFDLVNEVAADINGVLVESVFQTFDPKTKSYHAVSADGTVWLERRIRNIQMLKLPVYAVDYVQPDQKELAKETAKKLSALGCIPFVTTHDLNGTALAPLCEVPRRVLVLYGYDPEFADKPAATPGETLTGRSLQQPLQWLGYQCEYLNIGSQALPDPLPSRYAAVIFDGNLQLRSDQEKLAARWLERRKERRIPILFAGSIAFRDGEARSQVATALGFSGSLKSVRGVRKMSVSKLDGGVMKADGEITPRVLGFKNIVAPLSSSVFLSVRGEDHDGNSVRFDPIFLASWGGMLLEPYIAFRASSESQSLLVDPIRYLGQWLGAVSVFPVPDTTTRDGRRLFFSHVSGEDFTKTSSYPGHPLCAEVVRSRILKQYPLPVTVSITGSGTAVAAETGLAADVSQRHENVARGILSMPNVEPTNFNAAKYPVELSGAVAGFQADEKPRRLRAVSVLYDFGIATNPQAVRGLEKVYDWCASQPLHPVTAHDQARISVDASVTKSFRVGENHWLISNAGKLRTFRVPANAGVPDMARCQGVSGYKTEGDITYIHTTGRFLTELVLVEPAAATPDQLRLVESGADVTFHELTSHSALFQVGGWNTVEVVFGGIAPGSMVTIKKNKESGRLQADASGMLKLTLPPRSTVTLNVPRMPYAASR